MCIALAEPETTNFDKSEGDLELSGQVTFTGRSSMEIQMQVGKAPAKGEQVKSKDVLMTCAFTMVGRISRYFYAPILTWHFYPGLARPVDKEVWNSTPFY